jgi:hypothetical protein
VFLKTASKQFQAKTWCLVKNLAFFVLTDQDFRQPQIPKQEFGQNQEFGLSIP